MRSEGVTAVAAVVLGLLIVSWAIFASRTAETRTETITSTSTVTSSITGLRELTFVQRPTLCCPGPSCFESYFAPWSVTLWNSVIGNLTLANPPNTMTVDVAAWVTGVGSPKYQNFSMITFTVPVGSYSYSASAAVGYLNGKVLSENATGKTTTFGTNFTVEVTIPYCCGDACP